MLVKDELRLITNEKKKKAEVDSKKRYLRLLRGQCGRVIKK